MKRTKPIGLEELWDYEEKHPVVFASPRSLAEARLIAALERPSGIIGGARPETAAPLPQPQARGVDSLSIDCPSVNPQLSALNQLRLTMSSQPFSSECDWLGPVFRCGMRNEHLVKNSLTAVATPR